jgi:hypothetical protein
MEAVTDSGGATPQVAEPLLKKTVSDLLEVGAAVTTGGDPAVMSTFTKPPTLMALLGMSAVLAIIAYVIAEISNYYEIRRNWSYYRCMPSVAPFAKFYGHDFKETMNFCVGEAVKEHAPGVITPIYNGVEQVMGVVENVFDKAEAVEGGIKGLLTGFEKFVVNFMNSMRLVGTRIRMSVVRIKEIFQRVYGIFISFTFAAISAITFGENLVCNPLVTFVAGIAGVDICCFAPETRIAMADGGFKEIRRVKIGDCLADGGRVCSVYMFDGQGTKMVTVHGIHVSGNHYLRGPDGHMVRADTHPDAVPAPALPFIYCLGTSTNTIPILPGVGVGVGATRPIEFADYEESSDPEVIAEAQAAIEEALNGPGGAGPTVPDYSLGLSMGVRVPMMSGEMKMLASVRIGDILENGSVVKGIIEEECATFCRTSSGEIIAAAQLLYRRGRWVRAGTVWPIATDIEPQILYHLMVTGNKGFRIVDPLSDTKGFMVRDYAEWDGPEAQAPYDAALLAKS